MVRVPQIKILPGGLLMLSLLVFLSDVLEKAAGKEEPFPLHFLVYFGFDIEGYIFVPIGRNHQHNPL